ncbi:MAG: SNF2-related protein [Nostocales cyanobacterium 94392]|nr:SNF2-related protein [Nostocales cyanobacterium 94392]
MAILHGSWLLRGQGSCFFVWGETWRSISTDFTEDELIGVRAHHGAMTPLELLELLRSRNLAIPDKWLQTQTENSKVKSGKKTKSTASDDITLANESIVVALPTHIPQPEKKKKKKSEIDIIYPLHSGINQAGTGKPQYLHPWQVNGFCFNPRETIKFLTSLPMNIANDEQTFVGGDLRFWSQVARWSLDLIARCKFLPKIIDASGNLKIASWEALLDSAVDGSRLDKYSRSMPMSCRVYQGETGANNYPLINLLPESELLLLDFLNKTIDAQVRAMVNSLDAGETRLLASLPSVVRQWLHSLTSNKNSISADTPEVERLEAALNAWTMPLQNQLGQRSLFRTCFVLRTPQPEETEWLLEYYLQAIDDQEFLLDAQTIWNHPVERLVYQNRIIDKPQETFLRGLGLASRLYPVITPSLETPLPQSCRLEPMRAYDFIKSVTWRLEDSGLGVVLPASLANRDGWANRLGLKVSAQTPKKAERLGLQSLLNFQWELAIGGQTLSKQQFDKLVALNSPLVEINGEWVELRPQDIKTAQTFFAGRKDKMALSLEDALRLGSGDTQTIEKLPVVSFEASGALEELIKNLTDNQEIELLPTPNNFRGELRPYQRRGMSWLSFLERWGLGACLADDMGLGKCVAPDTQIYINGCLNAAEQIWQSYAGKTKFDGEGFWSEPTEQLMVNSINESTGEIIQAPIRRLYRQQVKERLRKISLQDGSSITITRRHKLLTNKGWTNYLEVGDYIGVPRNNPSANLRENLSVPLRLKNTTLLLEDYLLKNRRGAEYTEKVNKKVLASDVSYSEIERIEDVDYAGWVYDFEVEKHHNFVANNIICHNTIQFIAFLLHLQEEEALENPVLLVCPTSVLGNWEREVKKFAPNLQVLQYHGDKRPKGKAFQNAVKEKNIVITSYSLVHRDLKSLQDIYWQIIALDEAQNIKNPEAKQSQAVRQLEPEFRIALTGTPVENRLQELWSIMDFLNPGYLGNRQFFQRRFAMPIEKYGDTSSLSQLRSLVQPFILRRLKTDRNIIQDLPEKQEMTVFCGLTPEQAKLYQQVVEDSLTQIDNAEGLQRRGMILGLLVKLKQICNHPAQYLKKDELNKHDSTKLQRLEEMLEEVILNGDRALIFTQFAEWGKLLKPYLEKHFNRETLFLYGSTSKKQREEMIDRFQQDPQGPQVMILSLKAGGVGLNLTRANHVFHFDRWWNPAVENQATDRVFRIGQTKNVQVHKFVCTGTLEEKIHDMIESKKQLAEQVVGGGEEWLTEMDTDQLRNLLILDRDAVIEEDS